MQLTKKINTTRNLPLDDYVNKDTGETILSEHKDKISITTRVGTNQFTISSDNYIVFDSNAIMYISQYLTKADVARVMTIANMVIGECSVICQGNNHPHTSETFSVALDMCQDEFYKMVKRLIKNNVLAYCVCAPSGYVQKIYMLNPYIARRRKFLNCELQTFFRDITQDGAIQP